MLTSGRCEQRSRLRVKIQNKPSSGAKTFEWPKSRLYAFLNAAVTPADLQERLYERVMRMSLAPARTRA